MIVNPQPTIAAAAPGPPLTYGTAVPGDGHTAMNSARMTKADSFYPFDAARGRSDNDFDINIVASYLELNKLQERLLLRWLQGLEVKLWFSIDKDETDPPQLVLSVFTDNATGDGTFVADVNLLHLFKGEGFEFSQIGDAKEIQALEELRTAIEAAIAARKPGIEE